MLLATRAQRLISYISSNSRDNVWHFLSNLSHFAGSESINIPVQSREFPDRSSRGLARTLATTPMAAIAGCCFITTTNGSKNSETDACRSRARQFYFNGRCVIPINQIAGSLISMTIPGLIRDSRARLACGIAFGQTQRVDEGVMRIPNTCLRFATRRLARQISIFLPPPPRFASRGLAHYSHTRQVHRPSYTKRDDNVLLVGGPLFRGHCDVQTQEKSGYTVRLSLFSGGGVEANGNIFGITTRRSRLIEIIINSIFPSSFFLFIFHIKIN